MNNKFLDDFMKIVEIHSPKFFINCRSEIIIEPKNNIYFRLEDVKTEMDLKCKILHWLSRPSCKGVSPYWQKRIRNIVNQYLKTDFTHEEMLTIYIYLGNGCNENKTIKFIESGYDLSLLVD